MARLDKYGMNVKQRKFADRYLLNGNNAAEAYRYAYNPKADDKKAANLGYRVLNQSAIQVYIENKQAEYNAIAEEKQQMSAEKLIELLTKIVNGEVDDVDYTVETETETAGAMGSSTSSSTKTKRISKQWAADRLIALLGADKTATANQNNVIIEEID